MLNEPLNYHTVVGPPTGGLEHPLVPGHLVEYLVDPGGRRLTSDVLQRTGVQEATAFVHARRRRQRDRRQLRRSHHPAVPALLIISSPEGDSASWLPYLRDVVKPFPVHGCLAMVPSPEVLMVLPLVDITCVGWLDVLARAGRQAHAESDTPLSQELFWVHPSGIAAFTSRKRASDLELLPPEGFSQALQRLARRARRKVDAVA